MIRASQPTVDGLASLSTVWAVMEAARAGASDARMAAKGFLPAASKAMAGGLHAAGFAIGYAVAFPACLLARAVPRNNPIVYGLADGGLAGVDLARSTLQSTTNPIQAAASPALSLASANA